MASVAAFTAAAGSVEPPGAPVPPVPPPDACDELVPDVDCREDEVVAALDVLLVVVDDDAYVCWSVWYADIADLYAASAASTAFCSGVLLIDASASPTVTVSPALTLTAVTIPLVGKLTLACVT